VQELLRFLLSALEEILDSRSLPPLSWRVLEPDGVAGIGGVLGDSEGAPWAIPVGDGVDPDGKRTSQRAELLVAIEGLGRLSEDDYDHGITPRPPSRTRGRCLSLKIRTRAKGPKAQPRVLIVIPTVFCAHTLFKASHGSFDHVGLLLLCYHFHHFYIRPYAITLDFVAAQGLPGVSPTPLNRQVCRQRKERFD